MVQFSGVMPLALVLFMFSKLYPSLFINLKAVAGRLVFEKKFVKTSILSSKTMKRIKAYLYKYR